MCIIPVQLFVSSRRLCIPRAEGCCYVSRKIIPSYITKSRIFNAALYVDFFYCIIDLNVLFVFLSSILKKLRLVPCLFNMKY